VPLEDDERKNSRKKKKQKINTTVDSTTQLPKDVVMAISCFLQGLDIVCFLMTQKKWYTWFEQNGDFWKTQCQLFLRGEMHKKLEKITCLQSYLKMVIDGCIECGKFANYYPIIGQNLCDECKEKNKYKLINKTEAKKILQSQRFRFKKFIFSYTWDWVLLFRIRCC